MTILPRVVAEDLAGPELAARLLVSGLRRRPTDPYARRRGATSVLEIGSRASMELACLLVNSRTLCVEWCVWQHVR